MPKTKHTIQYALPQIAPVLLVSCFMLLCFNSCVKKSLYKTELNNRQLAEAREKVLYGELTDRKAEAAKMVLSIGDLNKNVGRQESEIAELRSRIVQLSNSANKTTASLLDEKITLEKSLKEKTTVLAETAAELNRLNSIAAAEALKRSTLSNLLTAKFDGNAAISIKILDQKVVMTIADDAVFEANGLNLNQSGLTILDSLSKILLEQPALPIQIITYTDNQLPKNAKSLTDTWDWSLKRATTIARALMSDYGVNANQITPTGRGEFYPVATNETPEGRLLNRRVEMVFF